MSENQSNNINTFEELFRAHKNRVCDFAIKILNSRAAAEDITQEVFLRLLDKRDKTEDIKNPAAWLFVLTRNLCLNHIRDHKREVHDYLLSDDPEGPPKNNPAQIKLKRAISILPSPLKETLILRVYEGFSYKEIAGITGTSVPAVKSALFRARVILKESFEKK